jgi:ubiquinone/menaquinone biosynthesis C-methylase UbiE
MEKQEKIKEYWDEQAVMHKDQCEATTPDQVYKELEIRNILKYIPDNASVLDIGCGNGFSTIKFAEERNISILGIDYSENMIKYAEDNLKNKPELSERVSFKVVDVLELSNKIQDNFDVMITERCLINLTSFEKQQEAIKQIHSLLAEKGKFIMCENTVQGMEKINSLRRDVGLYEIKIRWHNLYFDENELHPFLKEFFNIEEINPFASTYYIASRVFNAKLTPENQEPSFDSPINKISLELRNIGDFCPVRIYFLSKK